MARLVICMCGWACIARSSKQPRALTLEERLNRPFSASQTRASARRARRCTRGDEWETSRCFLKVCHNPLTPLSLLTLPCLHSLSPAAQRAPAAGRSTRRPPLTTFRMTVSTSMPDLMFNLGSDLGFDGFDLGVEVGLDSGVEIQLDLAVDLGFDRARFGCRFRVNLGEVV